MKFTRINYLFIAAFLLLTAACTDMNETRQLDQIQAMNTSLDSIETAMKANQLDSGVQYAAMAEEVEYRIRNNYFSDTINVALGRKMDAYKVMRRKFKPLRFSYKNILKGCEEVHESLRQLKHDIQNGDGERQKYDEFLGFEQDKVNQLLGLSSEYADLKAKTLQTYDELHEELKAFSFELEKKALAGKK